MTERNIGSDITTPRHRAPGLVTYPDLVVTGATDIAAAREKNTWLARPRFRSVQIENTTLNCDDVSKFEKRILWHFNACGCSATALVFLATCGLLTADFELIGHFSWSNLATTILLSALAAVVAKLTALFVIHRRLEKTLDRLLARYIAETDR